IYKRKKMMFVSFHVLVKLIMVIHFYFSGIESMPDICMQFSYTKLNSEIADGSNCMDQQPVS
ncbi:MAG: hypothetical protein Q8K40_07900, partial [Ignavibacteria bacterium]|nr:hypothetical protein [Ignavibacteria bacterium]